MLNQVIKGRCQWRNQVGLVHPERLAGEIYQVLVYGDQVRKNQHQNRLIQFEVELIPGVWLQRGQTNPDMAPVFLGSHYTERKLFAETTK